jgi:DNA-binding response OmpR family regulator
VLVLLDLTLPGRDGLEVLTAIRSQLPDPPVIVLTARAAIEQRVEGLDLGANDCVTKPFSFEERNARVRAHLRSPGQREASALEADDLRLDLRTRRVTRGGHDIQLTAREFELLAYLMRHPDQVLSREQILKRRLGLRLRSRYKSARGVHRLPAPEAHRSRWSGPDPDGPQRRLPATRPSWLGAV